MDNFVGKEDDKSSETKEDLSSADSESRTHAANWNVTSEHHLTPVLSSEDLGDKRKHETTDADSIKKLRFFSGTKRQQDIHFNIAETPSNTAESAISSFLDESVIRHTQDELLRMSSPPENATPELINEAEDYVQANSSINVCDDAHAVEGSLPFICDVCDKGFFFKSGLDRHYVTHSGEKPFSCQICEQKFSVGSNLRRHMLTHSEQKAHECDRCHKFYTRKDNLERHYRIHTGEKPYTCAECGRSFSDPSPFRKHRKRCRSSSKAD